MSIVCPIFSIISESAVFDVCKDDAERPWCKLTYSGSSLLRPLAPREGGSSGESEFEDSLIGTSVRGGGFGSRKSRGRCVRELSVERRSSSGVFANLDHQLSERRREAVMGGFASMMDDGRRGDCGGVPLGAGLRTCSAEEFVYSGDENACEESELAEGSDTVSNDGFSERGDRRVTSFIARAYICERGGGSSRDGGCPNSTGSESYSSSPGSLNESTSYSAKGSS